MFHLQDMPEDQPEASQSCLLRDNILSVPPNIIHKLFPEYELRSVPIRVPAIPFYPSKGSQIPNITLVITTAAEADKLLASAQHSMSAATGGADPAGGGSTSMGRRAVDHGTRSHCHGACASSSSSNCDEDDVLAASGVHVDMQLEVNLLMRLDNPMCLIRDAHGLRKQQRNLLGLLTKGQRVVSLTRVGAGHLVMAMEDGYMARQTRSKARQKGERTSTGVYNMLP